MNNKKRKKNINEASSKEMFSIKKKTVHLFYISFKIYRNERLKLNNFMQFYTSEQTIE